MYPVIGVLLFLAFAAAEVVMLHRLIRRGEDGSAILGSAILMLIGFIAVFTIFVGIALSVGRG